MPYNKKWNFDEYNWFENYDERMRNTTRLRYHETLAEVAKSASVKEGDLVLDIGTGTGNLAFRFLEKGCRVIGLDPSVKLLEMAEQISVWYYLFIDTKNKVSIRP